MSSEVPPAAWAAYVMAAFSRRGLTTDAKIGAAGGPSTTTLTTYRALVHGARDDIATPRDDVFSKIDTAAHWAPGSARRFWHEGVEPVDRDSSAGEEAAPFSPVAGLGAYLQRLEARLADLEARVDDLDADQGIYVDRAALDRRDNKR